MGMALSVYEHPNNNDEEDQDMDVFLKAVECVTRTVLFVFLIGVATGFVLAFATALPQSIATTLPHLLNAPAVTIMFVSWLVFKFASNYHTKSAPSFSDLNVIVCNSHRLSRAEWYLRSSEPVMALHAYCEYLEALSSIDTSLRHLDKTTVNLIHITCEASRRCKNTSHLLVRMERVIALFPELV